MITKPATTSISSTQKVYSELRRLVIAGEIEPGSRLKIDDLKHQLQAGASPIREALSLLTSDQLVERIDQRGFRAAAVSRAHFNEILELRCELEILALRASIEHGEGAWQDRLQLAEKRLAATERSMITRWEELHRRYHCTLIDACESPILLRFCVQLYDLNIRYRNLAQRSLDYRLRNITDEHMAIVDSAIQGDANLASERLRQHYTLTGDYLANCLSDIGMP